MRRTRKTTRLQPKTRCDSHTRKQPNWPTIGWKAHPKETSWSIAPSRWKVKSKVSPFKKKQQDEFDYIHKTHQWIPNAVELQRHQAFERPPSRYNNRWNTKNLLNSCSLHGGSVHESRVNIDCLSLMSFASCYKNFLCKVHHVRFKLFVQATLKFYQSFVEDGIGTSQSLANHIPNNILDFLPEIHLQPCKGMMFWKGLVICLTEATLD